MAKPGILSPGYFDGVMAASTDLPSSIDSHAASPGGVLTASPPTFSCRSSQTLFSLPEISEDVYSPGGMVNTNGQLEDDPLPDDETTSIRDRARAADRHIRQRMQYIKLLEDRMSAIEEKIEIFFKESQPIEPQSKPMACPAHLILGRIQLRWSDFKYSQRSGKFVIDVLDGDPDLEHLSMPKRGGPHYSSKDYEYFASRPYQPSEVRSLFPERIRINSTAVTNILRKVTSLTIPHPPVILRPYKMLVHFEKEIREHWKDLEKKWEGHMPSYADAGQETTPGCSEHEVRGQSDDRQKNAIKTDEKDNSVTAIDSKAALRQLRVLIRFMDEYIEPPLQRLNSEDCPHVFFADLWHLYKPGEEVYCPPGNGSHAFGISQAYRILQVTGGRRYLVGKEMSKDTGDDLTMHHEKYSPLVVSCVYFDFDGKAFGPIKHTFAIREYKGKKSLRALSVYPLRCAENPEQLRKTLQDRGDAFTKLAQVSHSHYEGLTLEPKEEIDSQIIVDFEVTLQNYPEWRPDFNMDYPPPSDPRETTESAPNGCADLNCCRNDYIFKDEALDPRLMSEFVESYPLLSDKARSWGLSDLSADDKRLLPGRVFAFILRSRSWAALDIGFVKAIPEKPDGFEQLVLPRGHKELVRALVKTHSCGSNPATYGAGAENQVDLVKGKGTNKSCQLLVKGIALNLASGKGLIILLHGAPGVGKTSTAESVAEYTKRPLFPITCGDIGETAPIIEKNLEKNFQLAHRWGCVLLLDEADVFLTKRGGDDMQRNSLVSVFLRVLEYYSGILFLTTNRVGVIDPAFKSRIHISLYYPPLDEISTLKVWEVNIQRARANAKRYIIDEEEIMEFAAHHYRTNSRASRWNGRQIRNAFQTAIALAEYDVGDRMRKALEEGIALGPPEISTQRGRLTKEHFSKVAMVSSDFDHYIKEVYGGRDESDRARDDSMRKDDWGETTAHIRPPYGRPSSSLYQQAKSTLQHHQGQGGFNSPANSARVPSIVDDFNSFDESMHPQMLSRYGVRRPSMEPPDNVSSRQTQRSRHGSAVVEQLNRGPPPPPRTLSPDPRYQQPLGSNVRANSRTRYGRSSMEVSQDFRLEMECEYDEQGTHMDGSLRV